MCQTFLRARSDVCEDECRWAHHLPAASVTRGAVVVRPECACPDRKYLLHVPGSLSVQSVQGFAGGTLCQSDVLAAGVNDFRGGWGVLDHHTMVNIVI